MNKQLWAYGAGIIALATYIGVNIPIIEKKMDLKASGSDFVAEDTVEIKEYTPSLSLKYDFEMDIFNNFKQVTYLKNYGREGVDIESVVVNGREGCLLSLYGLSMDDIKKWDIVKTLTDDGTEDEALDGIPPEIQKTAADYTIADLDFRPVRIGYDPGHVIRGVTLQPGDSIKIKYPESRCGKDIIFLEVRNGDASFELIG